MTVGKLVRGSVLGTVALFALMQLVPYGRDHHNPPETRAVPWPDARTYALARRACLDCHSNHTVWPWYSHVAPMSWLVYRDVRLGRRHVNFDQWDQEQDGSDDTSEMIRKGKMPYAPYLLIHAEARLTPAEKDELMKGLEAIIALGDPGPDFGKAPSVTANKDDDDDKEDQPAAQPSPAAAAIVAPPLKRD